MIKKYFYTCSSVIEGKLVAETFFIPSREEAYTLFEQKYGEKPSFLDGPFYRKLEKNKKKIKTNTVQLSNEMVSGIYKGFKIKAVKLKDPSNYVYIIFTDCKDKSINIKENNIVHISEIKEMS
jgi:hypothetical protein